MLILKGIWNFIINNPVVRLILVFLLGILIGALFYPTKTIKEQESLKYERQIEEMKTTHDKTVTDLNEKYTKEVTTVQNKLTEVQQSYSKATTENKELRQKVKKRTIKISKPDGTVIERVLEESESEAITKVTEDLKQSYEKKISDIMTNITKENQEKIEKIIAERDAEIKLKESQIEEYKKSKQVEINKKRSGISAGYMSDRQYFGSFEQDIIGPIFLDVTGTSDFTNKAAVGVGIGVRW